MNYKEIITDQTNFFNSNITKDIGFRIEQLKKLKTVIRNYEEILYKAIYEDFKKSKFDTYTTEISFIYHSIDEAIKMLPKWSKRKRVRTNIINQPAKSFIISEPLGVCLIIGAWNYPYQLSLLPLIAAVVSGNTVVLKPSEIPLKTSNVMARMINENFSSEYIMVVEGGIAETTELLNQKFDKIFFTGSVAVGKIVYQAAAKNLTPVTLELGGKSPAIVTKDCNINDAAKRIVWAKFVNSGQTCIAPDFVLVDEEVKEKFLVKVKEYVEKFKYSFENSNYIQIINESNFNRLSELIDENKIFFGGERDIAQRFISPTILTNVSFDDKVMEDEIFGPILPIISYSDLNKAIFEIKSRPKPLACYIFTDNKSTKEKLLKEISFGGGAVNDAIMHISNSNLPFGGIGNSGIGSYHGEAGFVAFSHYKSILDKPSSFELNLKYSPYSDRKLFWIKKIWG